MGTLVTGTMAAKSYGELFEFDIENILREGDLSRWELFRWWLGHGATFSCGRCGDEFSPRAAEVDEDDEILCARCRGKGRERR